MPADEFVLAQAQRIAGVGIWQLGVETGSLVWSEEVYRIFGRSRTDFEPSFDNFLDCVHPDDRTKLIEKQTRALNGTEPLDIEHRILLPEGATGFVRERAELITLPTGTRVLLGTVQDLTERKRSEALLAEQAAAIEAMQTELIFLSRQKAMGTMAATLAHELNQPLTAIMNYAATARRLLGQSSGALDKVDQSLRHIARSAARAAEVIKRLREMTKKGSTQKELFSPEQAIKDAAYFAATGVCEGVKLEYRFGDGIEVCADRVQIQQVIINLVRNACEVIADLEAKEITITTSSAEEGIKICVADNGPGIPEQIVPTLFDGVISQKPEGMGLGLSISRAIVEAHGGSIWVEHSDVGACVCFSIPKE